MDRLLLTCTQVSTYLGNNALTTASGFFFSHDERLFLVTSRHVVTDPQAGHHPDRIALALHVDATDLTQVVAVSLPLYVNGLSQWRQGEDSGGAIDVAALEIDRKLLPANAQIESFTLDDLQTVLEDIAIGTPLLILGFPRGFHDTRHHLAVARQAAVASAFGVRFQGQGCFLTDARTHRGMSGAPVVMRTARHQGPLRATLLGIHSSTMDVSGRDQLLDDALGLNVAWYADILLTLTA
jgi:hypothetical protein